VRVLPPDDGVLVVDLGPDENVLDREAMGTLAAALTGAARSEEVRAIVTTGSGRFFCNGLALPADGGPPPAGDLHELEALLTVVLGLPVPTVAAIPGHAFAGGALLALAHDRRIAREDRGFVCLPEVALGVPLTPGMLALLVDRLGRRTAGVVALEGRRYGGPEARELGLVDEAVPEAEVLPRAIERAHELAAGDPGAYAAMKAGLQRGTVRALAGQPRASSR